MRYVYMFAIILCLILAFITVTLGMNYYYEGHGLHPALAAVALVVLASLGWRAATKLDELEDSE